MVYDVYGILEDDPNRVKPFPPAATPVQFPRYTPSAPHHPRDSRRLEQLHKRLAKLTKPSDINSEDIGDLNIHVTRDVALENLIPTDAQGRSYMPPPEWDSTKSVPTGPEQNPRQLYTGEIAPERTVYLARKAELELDNADAYRAVHRQAPKGGGKIVTVGNHYKFWAALEQVSRYWDTSRDTEEEIKGKPNPPDPVKTDEDAMDIDTPSSKGKGYTGQRFAAGSDMPVSYLENCVKSFVETVAWLFRCQILNPSSRPRIIIGTSLFPVPLTQYVLKTPVDRTLARSGGMEGPLAGIFCRSTTLFQDPSVSPEGSHAEMVDLLQELLSLLTVAQERYREGKQDIKSGEGKWYTTVPRWGGGCGGEIGNQTGGNTDEALPSKRGASSSPSSSASATAGDAESNPVKDPMMNRLRNYRRTSRASGIPRQKKKESPLEAWKTLRPSPSLRDPNVRYQAIGKTKGSGYDNIFLFSAVNHHISIVRLRVYDEYITFLETGKAPPLTSSRSAAPSSLSSTFPPFSEKNNKNSTSRQWDRLDMARSRWYDFFKPEDRDEAMRGVWGVMAFLTRRLEDGGVEKTKVENEKKRKKSIGQAPAGVEGEQMEL